MKLSDIEPHFCEALAVQSIFMGFGIPPDDIYVIYSSASARLQALARQGELEFVVDVADLEMDKDACAKRWPEVIAAWNAAPVDERVRLTDRTEMRGAAVSIIAAMIAKGMRPRSVVMH